MKRTMYIIFGLLFFVVVSVAFTTYDQPRYKNLKILPKDIFKEALDSTMKFFAMSLGVKCGFCHVHSEDMKTWDMASDDKSEKLIARKMMLMANGINKIYFKPEPGDKSSIPAITCYSCHHGTEHPEPFPAAAPSEENKAEK